MENLYAFLDQHIVLTDVDEKQWFGIAMDVDDAIDNESGEDSLVLRNDGDKKLYDFFASDIKSIEIVE